MKQLQTIQLNGLSCCVVTATAISRYSIKLWKTTPQFFNSIRNRIAPLLIVAFARVNLDKHDMAIRDFDDALALNPKGVEAYMQRGELHVGKSEWQLAADDFEKAAALNPFVKGPVAKRALALAHLKDRHRQHPAMAVSDIASGSAVELPKDMRALMNLGYRYMSEGSFDEAIICYSEAVHREPSNPSARKYLAYAFYQRQEPAAAVTQFRALNLMKTLDMRDSMALGRCLVATGETDQALDMLDDLYHRDHQLEVKAEIAKIYLEKGSMDKAVHLARDGMNMSKTLAERKMFEDILESAKSPPAKSGSVDLSNGQCVSPATGSSK